jgi:hypothetical protein
MNFINAIVNPIADTVNYVIYTITGTSRKPKEVPIVIPSTIDIAKLKLCNDMYYKCYKTVNSMNGLTDIHKVYELCTSNRTMCTTRKLDSAI